MGAEGRRRFIGVVATVVVVVILLELGRTADVSSIFTGLGLDKALVIAVVVVLTVLAGWWVLATGRRGGSRHV